MLVANVEKPCARSESTDEVQSSTKIEALREELARCRSLKAVLMKPCT